MSTTNNYMMLFTGCEWYNELPPSEVKKIAEQAKAWLDGLVAKGKVKDGRGLERNGVRIAAKTGKVISDGPFAESKEAVGGYLIVEASSLDEAVALAKTNPTIAYGTSMEIRPVNRGEEDCPLYKRAMEAEPAIAAA